MWNRNFLFQIFILLLMKVSHIRSGCSWDKISQRNCSVQCTSSLLSADNINRTMENLKKTVLNWNERPDCNEDGIDLKLENVKYTDDTLKANFFTAEVKVKELTITFSPYILNLSNEITIALDAFHSDGLKFLKKLVINNFKLKPIRKGAFNGLEDLEMLTIDGTQLSAFETGALDVLNGTLKEISLLESTDNTERWVDALTGSIAMKKLEKVKFQCNLKTSISSKTFVGLTVVKTLDLSDCQIETIETGSFDSLNFMEVLNLKKNRLTTIPDCFFNIVLLRNNTQIYLEENPFICDCNLMPFKMSLIEHSNFVGQINCGSPERINGLSIITSTFDDEPCVLPTTTTTVVSSGSTPPPMQTCSPSDGSDTIFIAASAHKMQIYETENGDVILQVDRLTENSILIWFTSVSDPITNSIAASDSTNCIVGSGLTYRIDNLIKNLVYTICLMDRMNMTVSPLDCLSYVKEGHSIEMEPWLYNNQRSRMIGITLVVCTLSTLFGLAIGIFANKIKTWTFNRKEPFIRSYHSSRASSMRRSRMSVLTSDSYLTRRTTNTTVQYYLNGNYDAPPLPARPVSMYLMEEPVYATIRNFASICPPSQPLQVSESSNELSLRKI